MTATSVAVAGREHVPPAVRGGAVELGALVTHVCAVRSCSSRELDGPSHQIVAVGTTADGLHQVWLECLGTRRYPRKVSDRMSEIRRQRAAEHAGLVARRVKRYRHEPDYEPLPTSRRLCGELVEVAAALGVTTRP